MAILSLIARHCITTEAAKDVIDLLKVLCPENDTLQSISYGNDDIPWPAISTFFLEFLGIPNNSNLVF